MADRRIEDIAAGELTSIATNDKFVVLDASDTTDDPDGTTKFLQARTLGGLFRGSLIDGLVTSNNVTDSEHDIDIASGVATLSDGTNWVVASLSSAITKQIDAAWVVGTNQGGMDTGSVTVSSWYHVWLIMRSDTGVVDVLFSLSATAPTMPTSYDFKRRIGSVRTNGTSNIFAYVQTGDTYQWNTWEADHDADPGTAEILITTLVPSGFKIQWFGSLQITQAALSSATIRARLADPDIEDVSSASPEDRSIDLICDWHSSFGAKIAGEFRKITDTSSRLAFRTDYVNVSNVKLITHGWVDPRGRTV